MKKILISLLLFVFSFLSFGYCDLIPYNDFSVGANGTYSSIKGYCYSASTTACASDTDFYNSNDELIGYLTSPNDFYCFTEPGYFKNGNTISCSYHQYNLLNYTGSCLQIDSNYCVSNDLCPVPSNFSLLYINDIEHESSPVINIDIPEEFDWDYNLDDSGFYLDVIGYNQDTQYIDGIIRTQKSTPSEEDLNNIISGLIPLFVPGLVIILFLYLCFKLIKKIF